MRVYIYCTKARPMLRVAKEPLPNQKRAMTYENENGFTKYIVDEMYEGNGKIVGSFELNEVIPFAMWCETTIAIERGHNIDFDTILKRAKLTNEKMFEYVGKGKRYRYAWSIDDLEVFDRPMELSDFEIEKAPQSWCYATKYHYGIEADIPIKSEGVIIISIKPEWVEKILNGEKTLEIRKSVPKEIKKR